MLYRFGKYFARLSSAFTAVLLLELTLASIDPGANSFERIVLAFDADEAGREAARSVAALFDYNKVYQLSFSGTDRKDANDYLRFGESDELASLYSNADVSSLPR